MTRSRRRRGAPLEERELTALWLLGRVSQRLLPLPVLRFGRAGTGPGPDVREVSVALPSGVAVSGDVEVHLLASDFVRHGHLDDPAYRDVLLHVVWQDDRPAAERGGPTVLGVGRAAPTVAVGPAMGHAPSSVRARLRRGPAGGEPCAGFARRLGRGRAAELLKREGRRRLAERAWRAGRLAERVGWDRAWRALLDRALRSSAGRRHETDADRARLGALIDGRCLGPPPYSLAAVAIAGEPRRIIEFLRGPEPAATLGRGRAGEIGWNAVLPLLVALSSAYGDRALAVASTRMAERWPAPRPYGRTRALAALLDADEIQGGALCAQGLLHIQELWCERAGCGQCPCSPAAAESPG